MTRFHKLMAGLTTIFIFCFFSVAEAAMPVWTFLPLSSPHMTVSRNGTAMVQYKITNQSKRTHSLMMTPITGITLLTNPGDCDTPVTLGYQESCILTLLISGEQMKDNITEGPVLCQDGAGEFLCFRPKQDQTLNIKLTSNLNNYIYDADGTLWPYDVSESFMDWLGVRDEYDKICSLYGNQVCFTWVGKLWDGMTVDEVNTQLQAFVAWAEVNQPRLQPFPYMKNQLNSNIPTQNWIVSASPTILVQAWSKHLGLPVPQSNIIGVDTIIQNGVYTDEVLTPIPYRNGKVIKLKKYFTNDIEQIAGNTFVDYEMFLYGSYKLNTNILVINPKTDPTACGGYGDVGDLIQDTWKVVHLVL